MFKPASALMGYNYARMLVGDTNWTPNNYQSVYRMWELMWIMTAEQWTVIGRWAFTLSLFLYLPVSLMYSHRHLITFSSLCVLLSFRAIWHSLLKYNFQNESEKNNDSDFWNSSLQCLFKGCQYVPLRYNMYLWGTNMQPPPPIQLPHPNKIIKITYKIT